MNYYAMQEHAREYDMKQECKYDKPRTIHINPHTTWADIKEQLDITDEWIDEELTLEVMGWKK